MPIVINTNKQQRVSSLFIIMNILISVIFILLLAYKIKIVSIAKVLIIIEQTKKKLYGF